MSHIQKIRSMLNYRIGYLHGFTNMLYWKIKYRKQQRKLVEQIRKDKYLEETRAKFIIK